MILLALLACAPGEAPSCATTCPEGTRIATGTELEVVSGGGFYYSEGSCETLCEPFQPCFAPNVPSVFQVDGVDTYQCAPLDGFSELPATSEVDLSHGTWSSDLPDPSPLASGLGVPALWATVGDLDGDGADDVVAGSGTEVALILGGGAPTLSSSSAVVHRAEAADLDLDGVDELVVTFEEGDGTLGIRVDRWGGGWVEGPVLVHTSTYPTLDAWPDVADLDADGWPDLLLFLGGGATEGPNVAWGGPGGLGAPEWIGAQPCPGCWEPMRLADLDGDGLLDLLARQPVRLGPGRAWTSWPELPFDFRGCTVADLDGDGVSDATCPDEQLGTDAWYGTGDGGLALGPLLMGPCLHLPSSVLAADLDGDGADEVLHAASCEELAVLMPEHGVVELRALGLEDAALVVLDGLPVGVLP